MQTAKIRPQATSSFMEEIYRRHKLTIFTYILKHISSKEDAEDILLDVFITAFESPVIMTLKEHQQFVWLRRVAQYKSIDYLRRSKRQIAIPIELTMDTLYEDEQYSPEQVTLHQEEIARLQTHIATLSALQQEVIRLRFTHNMRCAEIATRLDKSEGAVRTLLSRTLNLLRNTYTNGRKEAHQYAMVNQTQTVDNRVVTLYAGYANSNNIILAYSSPRTTSQDNLAIMPLVLSAQKGVIFGGGGGNGSSEVGADMEYFIQSYALLKVPQDTTTLNITANKGSFHFSLPFHQGHVTNINQTQVSNGQAVTLEYVSVSPTMTRVFLKGPSFITGMAPAPNADPSIPPYQLTVGSWSDADHGRGFNSNATRENNDPQLPFTSLELDYSSPLMDQKGEWTLTLRNDIVSGATNDITFHFTA